MEQEEEKGGVREEEQSGKRNNIRVMHNTHVHSVIILAVVTFLLQSE